MKAMADMIQDTIVVFAKLGKANLTITLSTQEAKELCDSLNEAITEIKRFKEYEGLKRG